MSATWQKICHISDIPMLGARVVERPRGADIAIFRSTQDKVFAILDKCPHKGGPLSQGIVFGDKVACPLHNWNIELHSGCATAPDIGCSQIFQVHLDGDQVFLNSDEIQSLAIEP